LCEARCFGDALCDLIAVYYTFNIAYPKTVNPILTYIQKMELRINDPVKLLTAVIKITTAIDKM